MKNRTADYPRPVLNEYLKDFKDSSFQLTDPIIEETRDVINIKISYELVCPGIEKLITEGYAKAVLRLSCARSSYRNLYDLSLEGITEIEINKGLINEQVELQGMIIAVKEYKSYNLPEFNETYFSGMSFSLKKGDVIANEPGMEIKLEKVLEKTAAGIIKVAVNKDLWVPKVRYATIEEDDPKYTDYIILSLPKKEHKSYQNLTKKKHFRYGIERALQASLFLPIIVEAIDLIKEEEQYNPEEIDSHYIGTIWADSIIEALAKRGIEDITSSQASSVELANMLLGNVVSDSIDDLFQKMKEWSTVRNEEDTL